MPPETDSAALAERDAERENARIDARHRQHERELAVEGHVAAANEAAERAYRAANLSASAIRRFDFDNAETREGIHAGLDRALDAARRALKADGDDMPGFILRHRKVLCSSEVMPPEYLALVALAWAAEQADFTDALHQAADEPVPTSQPALSELSGAEIRSRRQAANRHAQEAREAERRAKARAREAGDIRREVEIGDLASADPARLAADQAQAAAEAADAALAATRDALDGSREV